MKTLLDVSSSVTTEGVQAYRECLCSTTSVVTSGSLPPSAASFFLGVSLSAQLKKEGSEDTRPTDLQVLYRKLAASTVNSPTVLRDFSRSYFSGAQLCLSKSGAEKVPHCLQATTDSDSSLGTFTPDASSAFSSLSTKRSLHQAKAKFPSVLPLLRQTCGESPTARCELTRVSKEEGVDQGCTPASFMYSTGVHPLLQEVKSVVGDQGLTKLFAGGGSTAAPTPKVACTTSLLASRGPSLGYSMSKSKGTCLLGKFQSCDEATSKKSFSLL